MNVRAAIQPPRSTSAARWLRRVETIRQTLRETERRVPLDRFGPASESARNLLHYLALRKFDLRALQEGLADLGLSSLGRAESHVLYNVDAVRSQLASMAHQEIAPELAPPPMNPREGRRRIERHASQLFGGAPPGRETRIMATMPVEAARRPALLRELVESGMDCVRINCAHDTKADWESIITTLRRLSASYSRSFRVEMDLSGPRLRTTSLPPRPAVLKVRPERDPFGRIVAPGRLRAVARESPHRSEGPMIVLPRAWIARRRLGQTVNLRDARGKSRRWVVTGRTSRDLVLACPKTTYLTNATVLRTRDPRTRRSDPITVEGILPRPGRLRLRPGDRFLLRIQERRPGAPHERAGGRSLPEVGAEPAEAFASIRVGQRVWFDGGRIGAVAVARPRAGVLLRVDQVRPGGDWIKADQGINLPDTELNLPPLTLQDREDLRFIAEHADLVGFSFVQSPEDVELLRSELVRLGRPRMGVVLKIETRHAFEQLPALLLSALRNGPMAVMVARGDLAVEVGFERLAEVQEEILWLCEAAHLPTIWATQVLEGMASTGRPTRAEVTDAAMGERAECIMLNKGPYLPQAIVALDSIVRRMQAHQAKKTARLRHLAVAERFLAEPVAANPRQGGLAVPVRSRAI